MDATCRFEVATRRFAFNFSRMVTHKSSRGSGDARRRIPNRRLQELRINAGLSPNALAIRAGVSGKTVRSAGRLAAIAESPVAIAAVFNTTPLELWPIGNSKLAAQTARGHRPSG